MMRRTQSVVVRVAAVIAAVVCVCVPARAQFGMGGDMTEFMSAISKKSLETYGRLVGMDKDQKDAAAALHEGYRAEFKAYRDEVKKTMQEAMEKMRDGGDPMSMGKEFAKVGQQMQVKMESIEKGFLNDVKALLNDKQQEVWPRVERMRRRENTMRFSFMSGQNVDLFRTVEAVGLKFDSTPELSQELERYEIELDKALKEFETWGKEYQEKQVKMMEDGDMAKMMEQVQKTMKEMGDYCRRMRDTNKQFARSVQAVLPADKQAKFEFEFRKKSFPRVYRESYASKAIAEAEKFTDLGADQKASIADLKSAYERDLESANKVWSAAIEENEEKHGGSIGVMMSGYMGGGGGKDSVGEARKARKDLDSQIKDRLLGMLRPEQKDRLPEDKPDPKDSNPMNWGFDIEPPEPDDD
jgi:hypothetical protein